MNSIVRCAGENVDLCATRVDDEAIELYTKWLNDRTASDYIGRSGNVVTQNDEREYILQMSQSSRIHFCLTNKSGTPLGLCELVPDYRNGHARIVILVGEPNLRGHGYGSEAINLLCKFAFDECRMRSVYARVNDYNLAAIGALKKASFTLCGTQHNFTFSNGEYHDVYIFERQKTNTTVQKEDN